MHLHLSTKKKKKCGGGDGSVASRITDGGITRIPSFK